MVPSTTVMMSIGTLVISFLAGFLFAYAMSNESKKEKKKQLENLLSYLINFIIFIWVGKIVLYIDVFIQDPLAILAYPSNAGAFYIATLLIAVNILFHIVRKKLSGKALLHVFVPVFLAASFLFELIQFILFDIRQAWVPLTLLAILLIVYIFTIEKVPKTLASLIFLISWMIGQLVLSMSNVHSTIFGYAISPYYFIGLLILVLLGIVYSNKRKV